MAPVTIPILPSADFDVTVAFWSLLGFAERDRWPGAYLILRHGGLGIELHFWPDANVDRWTNDVACYVRFDTPEDAAACRASWSDVAVPEPASIGPIVAEPWGALEFPVIDPHGNLVRLGGFPGQPGE